jgi:3-dehydroquinate dehydratase II
MKILVLQGANMPALGKRQPEIYGTTTASELDALLQAKALQSFKPPIVEVHMSNIDKRGRHSVTAEAAHGVIAGFGVKSYLLGLDALVDLIAERRGKTATA